MTDRQKRFCSEYLKDLNATQAHELTHAPDAVRYFIAGRPIAVVPERKDKRHGTDWDRQIEAFARFGR